MSVQDMMSSNAAERRQLLSFCTSALVLGGQLQAPAALPLVPIESELAGPESQYERFGAEKSFLLLRGIEFLTVHPVGAVHMGSVGNFGRLVVRVMNIGSKAVVWPAVCDILAQYMALWKNMCDIVAKRVIQWHNICDTLAY